MDSAMISRYISSIFPGFTRVLEMDLGVYRYMGSTLLSGYAMYIVYLSRFCPCLGGRGRWCWYMAMQ